MNRSKTTPALIIATVFGIANGYWLFKPELQSQQIAAVLERKKTEDRFVGAGARNEASVRGLDDSAATMTGESTRRPLGESSDSNRER